MKNKENDYYANNRPVGKQVTLHESNTQII